MNVEKFIKLIDNALTEANIYVILYIDGNEKSMADTKKVLQLLRNEVKQHPGNMNKRVLRAMHDIAGISVKIYEPSKLEKAIGEVNSILYYEALGYKELSPLRMDFGKGDPI